MPGPGERHEHGAKGEGHHEGGPPGHGKHGHGKHEGGEGPRKGRRGGKRGGKGKKRPDDEDDTSDEDSCEEDGDSDCCDDEEEEEYPGVRRAGRVAGKKWKKDNGIEGKIKNMTEKQKEEIRALKKQARVAFRKNARKEAKKEG